MLISPSSVKSQVFPILGVKDEWEHVSWPLPNMKQVTESDFWSWRCSYSFKAEINFVMAVKHDDETTRDVLGYIVDHSSMIDGGFLVLVDRSYRDPKPVLYYKFGLCEHNFEHQTIGNCLHEYTCKYCKKSYTVDSSG